MKFTACSIPDVVLIEPRIFEDERGYFFESFRADKFEQSIRKVSFVQDNESKSSRGVLRGLHYQSGEAAQSKLIRVVEGEIWDVAVDIRKGSPTFGKCVYETLSARNKKQLFIPRGFAHGFLVLSETAIVQYKVDNLYSPEHDRGIVYNDPAIQVPWPVKNLSIQLSEKDKNLPSLNEAELFDYHQNLYP